MKWRLRRQENEGGEWSVLDPKLDYRICHYNHAHHHGPHLHRPSDAKAGATIDVASAFEAEALMKRYHARHESFSQNLLNKEVASWKSESDAN